jgi:hypothetical protein
MFYIRNFKKLHLEFEFRKVGNTFFEKFNVINGRG